MTRDPAAEMGQGVREECSSEEIRDVVVPAHGYSLLAMCPENIVQQFRVFRGSRQKSVGAKGAKARLILKRLRGG